MAKSATPRRGSGRAATPAKARKAPAKAAPKRAAAPAAKRAAPAVSRKRFDELAARVAYLERCIDGLNANPKFLAAIGQRLVGEDGSGSGDGGSGGDGP